MKEPFHKTILIKFYLAKDKILNTVLPAAKTLPGLKLAKFWLKSGTLNERITLVVLVPLLNCDLKNVVVSNKPQ